MRWNVARRVFHEKFGYGRVVAIDGNKLEITFDKAGTKKVIDSFVTPRLSAVLITLDKVGCDTVLAK